MSGLCSRCTPSSSARVTLSQIKQPTNKKKKMPPHRTGNHRPRNPYGHRLHADGRGLAGAVPRWLRPGPRHKELRAIPAGDRRPAPTAGWGNGQRDLAEESADDGQGAAEAEPAVEDPLVCIAEGDSLLFDISSGCYPEYDKDSLLNTNAE